MKKIIIIVSTIFLLISCGKKQENKSKNKIDNRPYVSIDEVEEHEFVEKFQTSGTIKGIKEVDVYSKVSGKLIKYTVDEGQWVKKDQTIALIDRDVTGMEYKQAPVKSPINGVIALNYHDKGTTIMPGQVPVSKISNMNKVKIDVELPERYFPKIKKNQQVKINVDAYPNKTFKGYIKNHSPIIDQITHTVSAEIIIPNKNLKLRSGMFAKINIVFSRSDKTSIPQQALFGDNYVYTYKDGKVYINKIQPGKISNEYIEIDKGLKKGQKIVTIGQKFLKDGIEVRIR